jgi:hypothetical protein
MLAVPPSAIALSSIFLYNCTNAMFAYMINILHMSMPQLITLQAVSDSHMPSGCQQTVYELMSQIPSLIGCSVYILASNPPGGSLGPPGTRIALWAMAIFAMLATLPILFSLDLLTLSEHVSVNCLLPFVTALTSYFWLGESFTRTQAVCCRESRSSVLRGPLAYSIVICIAGVVMVVDPFRIREPEDSDHDRSDGIPDTLSGKLLGVGVSLLGIFLRAPQCKSLFPTCSSGAQS